MAGYSPAGILTDFPDRQRLNAYTFGDFLAQLRWLECEASDEEYWVAWRKVNGWPVPKRSQDSWVDRLKHRDTFLGRIAASLFGN